MISQTLIYMITVGLGQLVSLLLLPIITRYLSPALYGEYTLVLATTALVGTFGSSWVRNVAMRLHFDFAREGRSGALFWTAATVQAVPMVALLALGYGWTSWLGEPVSLTTYVAGSISLIVADFYTLSINTLRADQRAVPFGVAEITSGILRLAGTWIGLAAGFRTPALLFVFATASVLVAQVAAAGGLRRSLSGRPVFDRQAARELAELGLPSIPLWVGGWVMTLSNRTFLAWFLDLEAVGLYSVAQGVTERAITGLAAALYMMAWPAMLHTWTHAPEQAPRAIARFLTLYVFVSLGPAVALVLHREVILALLVGAAYRPAAEVVPLVVAGAWLIGLAGYLSRPLELRKAYGALSRITMAAAGINVILNVWLIPRYGTLGAAMSTAGAGACMVVLSAAAGARCHNLPIPWVPLGGAAAATVAASLLSMLVGAPLWALAVFALTYVSLTLVIWRHGMSQIVHGA
ncbi:MAG: polysaccharide biosynthesis protein [Acidobacteria bacterium]|nr:polysaccharide biosynthesis protein [Acidobacteriota bacterium]